MRAMKTVKSNVHESLMSTQEERFRRGKISLSNGYRCLRNKGVELLEIRGLGVKSADFCT
jgi:hypothetical protein